MPNLPFEPVSLVLGAGLITAVILYLREYNFRKKFEAHNNKFLEEIKKKGWDTLNASVKKSQAILGEAEIEGIKITAESRMERENLKEDFKKSLDTALNESKQAITGAQAQLLAFMQDLQKRSREFEEASKSSGEQRINQLFDRVENRLSEFLIQTEQKTTSSIELELKSARELVEAYKNEQLKLINENIIAMMEQTLSLVLGKKLSLKDQLDLVYEALERAKIEKFIV